MNIHEIAFVIPEVCNCYIAYLYDLEKVRELLPREKRFIKSALILSECTKTVVKLNAEKSPKMTDEITLEG